VATGPRPDIELRLDHGALGGTVGIGLQFHQFGLQRDILEQFVEALAGDRRNLDIEHVARHLFDDHLVLQQFGAHLVGIGAGLVDLVDRHDHRDPGRLGVVDRLDRLRHHRIIRGDDKDDDIGHLRATRPHRGEGGVARRVEEAQQRTRIGGHLIGADMLGDAPASPETTLVLRIASSSEVLPWSTWPMIVITGGRGRRFLPCPRWSG
jgi:hypothetical protein